LPQAAVAVHQVDLVVRVVEMESQQTEVVQLLGVLVAPMAQVAAVMELLVVAVA
jgi:hypothetical protein